ncbi:unnamed protein product, partial [Meganyctiphanes norvegica]
MKEHIDGENGVSANGVSANGVSANGVSANGSNNEDKKEPSKTVQPVEKEKLSNNDKVTTMASPKSLPVSPQIPNHVYRRRHSKTEMDLQAITLGIQSGNLASLGARQSVGFDVKKHASKLIEPECVMARAKQKTREMQQLSKRMSETA